MDDIYSNLENYNDEATLTELQNENKELKCKLEEYASNLDKLQKDFDKLSSEYKKLELNYSSLLKTARSEIERKTQHITNLNAEKDALVLKSLQNRYTRILPNNKSNLPKTKEDEPRFDKKAVIQSHNLESNRKESIFSPKEDMVKSGTDSSTKENISHKKTNVEENKARSIRNRRKSMPGFGMPAAKFSSDEDDPPFPARNLPSKEREYSDRNVDKNLKPSSRTYEGLDDRTSGNYERSRYYRNVETDKFRNHDRTDFSQRHKRDGSPGRHRRRPRDTYDDHQRIEHDKYRRHDSPIDKFNQYPRRPRSNYDRAIQEQERYKTRNQDRHTKHKISEFDEPKNKRFRPDSYTRYDEEKWCPEMQQMSEEFDKQYASCQSPDINFLESNPNHQITEIKLTANTELEDPRKASERYVVKQNEGKETIMAIRGINVDIAPIPIEKSSYNIESIKIPEALKEKPVTDDLINEIYKDVDNPQLNVSMESGEIPGDPQDIVLEYEIKDVSKNSKEISTKKDSINVNKQPHTSYKIPKLKICKSVTQTDKNISVAFSVKQNDDNNDNTIVNKNNSKNVTKLDLDLKKDDVNVNDNAHISKEVPLPLLSSQTDILNHEHINISKSVPKIDVDLKKDDIIVKDKASISKQTPLPLLSSQTDKLNDEHIIISKNVPEIDFDLKKGDTSVKDKKASVSIQMPLPLLSRHTDKLNHEHIKTKAAMKMVEDDLELSDETCDTDICKPKEKIIKTNTSSSEKRDHKTETKVITSQEKCNAENKKKDCKDLNINPSKDKKAKSKKRQHKEKNSPEEVKTKKSTDKLTKKKSKEKEVKTKEIETKFSELFGDSNSLISPEDLGLIAVQPPLNHPEAGFFEDAQDAIDVNVKETSLNSETLVDTTVVEVKKTDNKNNEEVDKELPLELNNSEEVRDKNSALVPKNVPTIQSVYQNLEVSPKAEDGNIKTVIISTGVQPSTEVFNKPITKILDQLEFPAKPPEQIDLKALATSTPLKLDNVQNVFKINPNIVEAHGNTNDNRNESTDNDTSDVSNSNNESKTIEADVPDIRMFVKRRRKVIKK